MSSKDNATTYIFLFGVILVVGYALTQFNTSVIPSLTIPSSEKPQYVVRNIVNGVNFGCMSIDKTSSFWQPSSPTPLPLSECLNVCKDLEKTKFTNKITGQLEFATCIGFLP